MRRKRARKMIYQPKKGVTCKQTLDLVARRDVLARLIKKATLNKEHLLAREYKESMDSLTDQLKFAPPLAFPASCYSFSDAAVGDVVGLSGGDFYVSAVAVVYATRCRHDGGLYHHVQDVETGSRCQLDEDVFNDERVILIKRGG